MNIHEVFCCLHDYIFVPVVRYLLMVQSVLVVHLAWLFFCEYVVIIFWILDCKWNLKSWSNTCCHCGVLMSCAFVVGGDSGSFSFWCLAEQTRLAMIQDWMSIQMATVFCIFLWPNDFVRGQNVNVNSAC